MSGSESENSDFESDIEAEAEKELSLLLPEKSKEVYQKVYDTFKKWCDDKKIKTINEKVLVAYFTVELKDFKATSLWTIYSKLRSTLHIYENFDISTFSNLKALLKLKSVGHNVKKSKTFTKEEFYRFIKEAPDDDYLAMKVNFIKYIFMGPVSSLPILGHSNCWRLRSMSSE